MLLDSLVNKVLTFMPPLKKGAAERSEAGDLLNIQIPPPPMASTPFFKGGELIRHFKITKAPLNPPDNLK